MFSFVAPDTGYAGFGTSITSPRERKKIHEARARTPKGFSKKKKRVKRIFHHRSKSSDETQSQYDFRYDADADEEMKMKSVGVRGVFRNIRKEKSNDRYRSTVLRDPFESVPLSRESDGEVEMSPLKKYGKKKSSMTPRIDVRVKEKTPDSIMRSSSIAIRGAEMRSHHLDGVSFQGRGRTNSAAGEIGTAGSVSSYKRQIGSNGVDGQALHPAILEMQKKKKLFEIMTEEGDPLGKVKSSSMNVEKKREILNYMKKLKETKKNRRKNKRNSDMVVRKKLMRSRLKNMSGGKRRRGSVKIVGKGSVGKVKNYTDGYALSKFDRDGFYDKRKNRWCQIEENSPASTTGGSPESSGSRGTPSPSEKMSFLEQQILYFVHPKKYYLWIPEEEVVVNVVWMLQKKKKLDQVLQVNSSNEESLFLKQTGKKAYLKNVDLEMVSQNIPEQDKISREMEKTRQILEKKLFQTIQSTFSEVIKMELRMYDCQTGLDVVDIGLKEYTEKIFKTKMGKIQKTVSKEAYQFLEKNIQIRSFNPKHYKLYIAETSGDLVDRYTNLDSTFSIDSYKTKNYTFVYNTRYLKAVKVRWGDYDENRNYERRITSAVCSSRNHIDNVSLSVFIDNNFEKAEKITIPPDLLVRDLLSSICEKCELNNKKFTLELIKDNKRIDISQRLKYKTVGYLVTVADVDRLHLSRGFVLSDAKVSQGPSSIQVSERIPLEKTGTQREDVLIPEDAIEQFIYREYQVVKVGILFSRTLILGFDGRRMIIKYPKYKRSIFATRISEKSHLIQKKVVKEMDKLSSITDFPKDHAKKFEITFHNMEVMTFICASKVEREEIVSNLKYLIKYYAYKLRCAHSIGPHSKRNKSLKGAEMMSNPAWSGSFGDF